MQEPGPFTVTVEERPAYLVVTASGERTAENARSTLAQAFAACVRADRQMLLLVMNLVGPRSTGAPSSR